MNFSNLTKTDLIQYIQSMETTPISEDSLAMDYIRLETINYQQENFILLVLSTANKPLKSKVIFKGARDASLVDPKLIFQEFLKTPYASSMIVAHNHPSGGLEPSHQDRLVTERLRKGCEILGIQFLDHLIFNQFNHVRVI